MKCLRCKKEVNSLYEIKITKVFEHEKVTFRDKLSKALSYGAEYNSETDKLRTSEVYYRKYCEECIPKEILISVGIEKL